MVFNHFLSGIVNIMNSNGLILTGHRGFIGSNLQCEHRIDRCVDLTDYSSTLATFSSITSPAGLIHCAAKHGSNEQMRTNHVDYVSNNLVTDINVLRAARNVGVKDVVCISSITSIPPVDKEYFTEDDLYSGEVNEPIFGYAWSKKATVSICKAFQLESGLNYKAILLGNAYGPGCKFHERAPVIANLICRIGKARKENHPYVSLYGDGKDVRSFIFVEDLDKIFKALLVDESLRGPIIVSSTETTTISALAFLIADELAYRGDVVFSGDVSCNVQRVKIAKSNVFDIDSYDLTSLREGIRRTISYYNTLSI